MKAELKIGQKWQFTIHRDNPWNKDKPTVAVIKDLKDGWVRYSFEGGAMIFEESEQLFRSLYKTLKEDVK